MAILQDITLGQYLPADSLLHRLDPRTKFVSILVLMIAALSTSSFASLLLCCGFLGMAMVLSGLPTSLVLRNLRPFLWLFLFTFALHALLTPGPPLWRVPYTDLAVTSQGLRRGIFFSLRLSVVIVMASLLTLTTSPLELTGGLARLFKPLRRFGFPAHELAMMVTISLRFIPVLIDEAERLRKAQLARGADFSGGPIRRARNLIPLLVPLFLSAFARADRLALAMESRCYQSGMERTNFRELRFADRDLIAALAVLATVLGIWLLSGFWPS